jgi:cytoskeletal protein RodZ
MRQKTVGELLQEERLKHAVAIPELAKLTRIRAEYLEALENNQFEKLPAATFVKAYIQIYASVFDFDHQPLLRLLRRDFKESAKGKLVPQEFLTPLIKKKTFVTPIALTVATLGLVFACIMGYIGFQWYQFQLPPVITISEPKEFSVVGPQTKVAGQTEPDAIVTIDAQPVSLQPDGSFSAEASFLKEGVGTIVIEVRDSRGKSNRVERNVQVQF